MKRDGHNFIKKAVTGLTRIPFVKRAIVEKADLSVFEKRLSRREIFGVLTIGVSYLLGWPLISLLGIFSIHFERSDIILLGGPVAYIISHLVFLLGMYLAGARYSWIFLRWLTRTIMLKLMKATNTRLPNDVPDT